MHSLKQSTGLLALLMVGACASQASEQIKLRQPLRFDPRPVQTSPGNPTASTEPSGPIQSLRELLGEIRANSPLLSAARSRAASSQASVDQRRALRRGEITPFAQVFQYDSDRLVNPISSPSGISPALFDDQQYGFGLEGRLPIDLNGQLKESIQSARARSKASEQETEVLWLQLSDQASGLYRGLQAIQGTRQALEVQRDALVDHIKVAQQSVDIGRLEPVEVLRLDAARDAVIGQLAALDGREANLRSGLAALLHRKAFGDPAEPQENSPTKAMDLGQDLSRRPDVKAGQLRVDSAAFAARAAGSAREPDLSVIGGLRWNDGFNSDGDTTAEIGLRLSWPAYDGGLRGSREQAARHEERAARMELAGILDRATAEAAASRAAWQAAQAGWLAAESGQKAAREAARVQRARYEANRLSSTDLLDAEARLAEASDALSRARANWWRADDSLYIAHGLVPRGDLSSDTTPSTKQP